MKNANVTYTMLFINLEFYMTFPNDISRLFCASFVDVTPIDWQAALSKIFTLAVINLMRNIFIYELSVKFLENITSEERLLRKYRNFWGYNVNSYLNRNLPNISTSLIENKNAWYVLKMKNVKRQLLDG